jgi:hypothetical protein
MKENSLLARPEVAESSWKSLVGVGSVALLLGGISQILNVVARVLIRPAFAAYVSTFPGAVLQEKDFLIFVSTHQLYYYMLFYSEALAASLAIFGVLAVFVILRHYDKGLAVVASALAITGIGVLISVVPNHLFLVQEAITYAGGCTPCAAEALSGASATFSANIGDSLGFLVVAIAVIVLSVLMFRRTVFGRGVASLGVFSGLIGILAGFLPGDPDFLFDLGLVPFVFVAVWFMAVGYRLYAVYEAS